MNSTTPPSSSGRCGMCGSCGTMPPWAPEMLKNTSPEDRRALERRMRQAQMRFIEERDARNKARELAQADQPNPPSQHHAPDSPKEVDMQISATEQENDQNWQAVAEGVDFRDEKQRNAIPLSDQTLENPREDPENLLVSSDEVPEASETDVDAERDFHTPMNSFPLVSEGQVEDDANVEIPLDTIAIPPLPPADRKEHQAETSNLHTDDYHAIQPPRRKLPSLSSPALLESPAPSATPELKPISEISLEPNERLEPLRTISLRDADSDADSFHTALGEDFVRLSSDDLSQKDDEQAENNVAPIVSEDEWQAFQDNEPIPVPEVSAPNILKPNLRESPVTSTEDNASLEGHTRDMANSEHPSPKAESGDSKPSENREDSATKGPQTSLGPSSPLAQRDTVVDDYAFPADLVQPNEIELKPQPCQDCERWRERVQALELKVEALTSALSAREMESASMRARVRDRHYHGRNEAQLIEECESLRITTEYLVRFLFCSPFYYVSNLFCLPLALHSMEDWSDTRKNLTEVTPLYISEKFWVQVTLT